jgi:hypothetical protein
MRMMKSRRMSRACSMYIREEECLEGFERKARRRKATRKMYT